LWHDRDEVFRYGAWIQRLGSKKDAIRNDEIEAMVALGPRGVPLLVELLNDKRCAERAKAAAATALGRIGGPEAVNALLDTLARQEREAVKRRKRAPFIIAAFLILVVGGAVIPLAFNHHLTAFQPAAYTGMIATVVAARAVGLRKSAAGALGALKEPRAVGPLALAMNEKALAATALPVLKDLMPQVRDEHAAEYTPEERAALIRLLGHKDADVVRGALRIVAMFGAEDAREPVERIIRDGPTVARPDAERALASIRGRIENQRDRETLLRASSSVDGVPTDELLRSAAAQPDPEPQQLLRPTEGPPPQ
jgi:HEAT repeat protein